MPMPDSSDPRFPVLIFDGECALCHGAVRHILRHERAPEFRFAALKSDYAARLAAGIAPDGLPVDTLIVVEPDSRKILVRSAAVLAIARRLRAPWPTLAAGFAMLPVAWRDALYDAVARRRLRFFGRAESACPMPSARQIGRLLQ